MHRTTKHILRPVIAYTRVSTKKQGREGHGLELQTVAIKAFAEAEGYQIVDSFTDTDTGMGEDSIRERPGVNAAINLSRQKGCPILVSRLDRFSRDTATVEDYVFKQGVKLIGCQEEGASHAVIVSIAARAQCEGELISRNTKRALQELKSRGVLLGNRKNLDKAQKKGAATNKALAEQRTQEMLPVIQELREAGRMSARAIAEGLNLKGLRTPQGREWTAINVRFLLNKVVALLNAQEHAKNLENDDWGRW